MDTKKTILVSFLTTLATMFIVAVIMHMCCGNCGGQSKCSKASVECSSSYGHGAHGGCSSYAKSCSSKKSCKSSGKSCSSKSKCKKASKCCKSKSSCKKGNVKTCKHKDGEKVIIKKEIKIEEEE